MSVEAQESVLNFTAEDLKDKIANISADAPAQRVLFNAIERTERIYPSSGSQVSNRSSKLK